MEYIHFAKDEPYLFCFLFMCANEYEEIVRKEIENRTENIKDEHYSVSWGF